MGLDIYAGTLTTYFGDDWENISQQWATENGYFFRQISSDENIDEKTSIGIQKGIESWRDNLLKALKSDTSWEENNEKDYFTHRPDWAAFGAMLLVGACYVYGQPIPRTISKDWIFPDDIYIQRLGDDKSKRWSLFQDVTCWLPLKEDLIFKAELPTGDEILFSTTACLRRDLERLNLLAWQADEETIYKWNETEGYSVELEIGEGGEVLWQAESETIEYDTESLAKFSFSIFYQALKFAEEHQVPIMMDF